MKLFAILLLLFVVSVSAAPVQDEEALEEWEDPSGKIAHQLALKAHALALQRHALGYRGRRHGTHGTHHAGHHAGHHVGYHAGHGGVIDHSKAVNALVQRFGKGHQGKVDLKKIQAAVRKMGYASAKKIGYKIGYKYGKGLGFKIGYNKAHLLALELHKGHKGLKNGKGHHGGGYQGHHVAKGGYHGNAHQWLGRHGHHGKGHNAQAHLGKH